MNLLTLSNVGHAFLGRAVLENINLEIRPGEIVALVGPSGCGKSTLAHIAANLIKPRNGRIERGYARQAMIFQEPALLPWATAAENIQYALRLRRMNRSARVCRLGEVAQQVSLEPDDLAKYPVELSGGMKQRVAIARALAIDPDFIYFDEPFTALDVALRQRMQNLVIQMFAGGCRSGLFITHDLQEAARIADRIAVLDTHGGGILGVRLVPDAPKDRTVKAIFDWVLSSLEDDPIFRHIHDVDERQIS